MDQALDFKYSTFRFQIAMANHHVAFDESGKIDTEHIVFAGLISMPDRWQKMNEKWHKLLAGEGLLYWRSSDANNLSGPFRIFRERRKDRDKLVMAVVELVCEFTNSGSINVIDNKTFKDLPEKDKRRYKDPFYWAFEAGIKQLVSAPDIPLADVITLVCDDSDDAINVLKVYRRLQSLHPEITNRIGGICFHDDRRYPPVQAADLYAYCFRRKMEGLSKSIWVEAMKQFDETFTVVTHGDIRIE